MRPHTKIKEMTLMFTVKFSEDAGIYIIELIDKSSEYSETFEHIKWREVVDLAYKYFKSATKEDEESQSVFVNESPS